MFYNVHDAPPRTTDNFYYSMSALQSTVIAGGILSVCPSCSSIVSRRMKIRSRGFKHLVGQSL